MKRYSKSIILAGILGFVLIVLPAQIKPWTYPSDDSFFYLQIANNIASGHGSTFNEIAPTNGYHPLWMVVCTAIAKVSGGNKMLLLRLTMGFQAILFVMIAFCFIQVAKLLKLDNYIIALPLLAVYFLAIGNYLSEVHLNTLIMLICIYYILINTGKWNWEKSMMTGFYLGLLFLARLDNIFIIFILMLFMVFNGRAGRLIFLTFLVTFLIMISYFAYNYHYFGNFITISTAIKSSFPVIHFDYNSLGSLGKAVTLIAAISVVWMLLTKNKISGKIFMIYAGVGVLLHAHFIVLFSDHLTNWPWYYAAGVVYACLVLVVITDVLRKKRLIPKILVAGFIFILSIMAISRSWSEYYNPDARGFNPFQFSARNGCRWQIETARLLKEKLPQGTAILMYDWPGMIAYFSGMDIVPIDGLVNDYDYQKRIVESGIESYMKENGIHYFIGPDFVYQQRIIGYENFPKINCRAEFKVYSSLYNRPGGSFFVNDSSIVLRFRDHVECSEMPDLALWKF